MTATENADTVAAENKKAAADGVAKKPPPSPEVVHASHIRKYRIAGGIGYQVMQTVISGCVEGASVMKLEMEADEAITKLAKGHFSNKFKGVEVLRGVAFPTCISINNVVSHFSPLISDPLASVTLAKGDVVKIQLGVHIDGFATIQSETLIVGASREDPATGRQADVVKAAYIAAELALRTMRAGEKNFAVTDIVNKAAAEWDCKPVEGMLSCQHDQHSIDGKKRIILNPTHEQKSGHEKATFAVGEVYGVDVLVTSSADGKSKPAEDARTSVYQHVSGMTYQLKLKASQALMEEVTKKCGHFPFTLRMMEDEKKARVGAQEAERHGVFRAYEVTKTPNDTFTAAFMFTVEITEAGPSLLTHPPIWYHPKKLRTLKGLEDKDLATLLASPLKKKPLKEGEEPKEAVAKAPKAPKDPAAPKEKTVDKKKPRGTAGAAEQAANAEAASGVATVAA